MSQTRVFTGIQNSDQRIDEGELLSLALVVFALPEIAKKHSYLRQI
jgi:hypothetical protein